MSCPATFAYAADPTLHSEERQGHDCFRYGLESPRVKNEVAGGGLEVTSWYINSVDCGRHRIAECMQSRPSTDLSVVLLAMAPRYQNRKMMGR